MFVFIVIFLMNAWASDDAYITFRSVEQFVHGHGMRWNPHERVQVFTHPLWFFVLSLVRVFSANVYLNALLISLFFDVLMLYFLWKTTKDIYRWFFIGLLLLVASKSFIDYTSSGLENPLTYFLCAVFFGTYLDLAMDHGEGGVLGENEIFSRLKMLFLLAGLLVTNRLDEILLVFPPLAACVWKYRSYGFSRLMKAAVLGFLPFIVWEIVSIIYYGFPFPNTAYAKLPPSVPLKFYIYHGINYISNSLAWDPIVLIVIASAVAASIISSDLMLAAIGAGLVLYLMYIIRIGGDFMAGRMFTSMYLASVIYFIKTVSFPRVFLKIAIFPILYILLLPASPLKSDMTYNCLFYKDGIMDERGEYFQHSSLWRYLQFKSHGSAFNVFPVHSWSSYGKKLSLNGPSMQVERCEGFLGYYSGANEKIIDLMALCDPLLARLPPMIGKLNIGHFERKVPAGYLRSVYLDNNSIVDADLRSYYDKIKIITQGRIFSAERLKVIVLMNTGRYDYLLKNAGDYKCDTIETLSALVGSHEK
jgi:arabinofuranosyltransferase